MRNVLDKINQTCDAIDLKIGAAVLGSRIAEAGHRLPEAMELLHTAVELQDNMPYSEPPAWFYPVRESLGALLLRSGSAVKSEAVFRESLRRVPNDPRALFGLAASLDAQGRKSDAADARVRFRDASKYSDVKFVLNDL